MSRIAPIAPPYEPETQKLFDVVMPEGMEPLELFRVLARSSRLFPRFMRAGVLDRGPLEIRDRELAIHRTTARCGAEYEWGVHANAFGRPLGFSDDFLRATVEARWDDAIFEPHQAAIVRLCDQLHDSATLDEITWRELATHFDELQILELIYIAGMYHTVSFFVNGLKLDREAVGARFEEVGARPLAGI